MIPIATPVLPVTMGSAASVQQVSRAGDTLGSDMVTIARSSVPAEATAQMHRVAAWGARFAVPVEVSGGPQEDWRVTLIDTGIWRNIGQRLWAVRDQVCREDVFLANYSDGLADVDLNDMIRRFKASGKVASFLAVHPPVTFHLADIEAGGRVCALRGSNEADLWINGGFFVMLPATFDYMQDGEELVIEPFRRLIADDQLLAYKHSGFWRVMDTLRDRQVLEGMVERGNMPWRLTPSAIKETSLGLVL